MIQTQNLCKRYGRFDAVHRLNMNVPQGTVFGMVGENGAGKTTTLSMLATLTTPTSGKAYINGFEVKRQPQDVRRSLGYMPDSFGVYDDLSAKEYLLFYAECYRVPRPVANQRCNELLAWVDLEDKRDSYVNALSRGMQQRLEIARCLMHDPPVLILDEPSSGLDPRSRIEMRQVLKRLRELGKTIIMSSHILHELGEIADEIGIIRGGELAAVASTSVMLAQSTAFRTLWISGEGDAAEWLKVFDRDRNVIDVHAQNEGFEVVYAGTVQQQADLLRSLVDEKLVVYRFTERPTDIEQLFLRLTDRTVSS